MVGYVVRYTNVAFRPNKSVLYMEVSSIKMCPDRDRIYSIWLETNLFEVDHHFTRQFHVFKHTLQFTSKVSPTF